MNGHAFSGASARGGLSLPIRPTSLVRDRQGDLGPQPVDPAEIVNYRSTGTTPTLLAVGLAAGAVTALGLTLAASVRRRRRDLALLKDSRLHPATVVRHRGVAGVSGRDGGGRGGRAARNRVRPLGVNPLRSRDLRGSSPVSTRRPDHHRRRGGADACDPRRDPAWAIRRPNPDVAPTSSGIGELRRVVSRIACSYGASAT